MWKNLEYRVCSVQNARVTFVNNDWQGRVEPDGSNHDEALASCPQVWDYLNEQGRYGWELSAVAPQNIGEVALQTLYLKREAP
jgi:hypothetical protein